jgi:hypothetical protein
MLWDESISASKIVKIAHQQTLEQLLSNYNCPFLNRYCLPLLRFLTISGVIESDSSEIYGVEKVRQEATSSMFWEEPSYASKIFKIAHQ